MDHRTLDTMSAVGSKATVAGASITGWGWIVSNEFFGLMGVAIALAGLLMNLYYRRKADRRLEIEAAQRAVERQIRIELMRAAQTPPCQEDESDFAKLEAAE